MNDSILITVKKLLGIEADYNFFDLDIITAINTALFALAQFNVGNKGFSINGPEQTWFDFLPNVENLEAVKSYIALKARMLFDPPTSSILAEAINANLKEIEWRLYTEVGNY